MDVESQMSIRPSGRSTPCVDTYSTFIPSIFPPNVLAPFCNIHLRIGDLAL